MCSCANGDPAETHTPCKAHLAEQCTGCDPGYKLEPETDGCVEVFSCVCPNGAAAEGSGCTSNGVTCVACNSGYHPGVKGCEPNVCTCGEGLTGTAAMGPDCEADGAETCASCNPGFGGASCTPTSCVCPHGVAAAGVAPEPLGAHTAKRDGGSTEHGVQVQCRQASASATGG